jgi:hypothetical protein
MRRAAITSPAKASFEKWLHVESISIHNWLHAAIPGCIWQTEVIVKSR